MDFRVNNPSKSAQSVTHLYQPHLGGHCNHPGHGHVEEPARRLLVLAQQVVEHAQQLQHSLFSPGVGQPRVIDHQIGVDLTIVPPDVESPGYQDISVIMMYNGTQSRKLLTLAAKAK